MNFMQKQLQIDESGLSKSKSKKNIFFFRTNNILIITFTIIFIVLLEGCASAEFVSTGKSYSPKPDNCEIEIFLTKNPDRKYEELGILEGEGSWGKDSFDSILPKLKTQACRAGGDAIIFSSSQKSVNIFPLGEGSGSDEKLNVRATVIKWID